MKVQVLRQRSAEELQKSLAELAEELFRLRFRLKSGRLHNTARMGRVRQEIARIRTVLREERPQG
ncbi:MAG: 50S ribosomal protein L29 [Deltaproteobacteria bacterium]|nr:50S ribosomal protein L29 [Deltaproteobacteria bacterium]